MITDGVVYGIGPVRPRKLHGRRITTLHERRQHCTDQAGRQAARYPGVNPATTGDGKSVGSVLHARSVLNTKWYLFETHARARLRGGALRHPHEPDCFPTSAIDQAAGPGQCTDPEKQRHQDLRHRPGIKHRRSTRTICQSLSSGASYTYITPTPSATAGHFQQDREGRSSSASCSEDGASRTAGTFLAVPEGEGTCS